jgi:hypothetical protein
MRLLVLLLLNTSFVASVVVASVVPVASADLPVWAVGKSTWIYVTDYQCSVFDWNSEDVGQTGFLVGYALAAMTYFTPMVLGSGQPMTLSRFTQAMTAKCQENPNLRLIDVTHWIMTGMPISGSP